MDIVELVVDAALATGLIGFVANRAWRWWRRPRLDVCYDPRREPRATMRRGATHGDSDEIFSFVEHFLTVKNDGRTPARSVEGVLELVEWWDGGEWRDPDRDTGPWYLLWTGTRETRVHLSPDGDERRLSVFVAGPLEGRGIKHLHPATPTNVVAEAPPVEGRIGPGKTRFRVTVTGMDGGSASIDLEVDWRNDPLRPSIETDEICPE